MKELYDWQKKAARSWWEKKRGVIQAVTGSGKTLVAAVLMQELIKRDPDMQVLIIVPTRPLLDQWGRILLNDLGIDPKDIGTFWAGSKDLQTKYIIGTYISCGKYYGMFDKLAKRGMIIADECHRSASDIHSKILSLDWKYRLGMSATVERNDGGHELIYKALGDLIYEYSYEAGVADRVISPYICYNCGFDLTGDEREVYADLSARMKDLRNNELRDVDIYGNKALLGMRSRLLSALGSGADLNTTISGMRDYYCDNQALRMYHLMANKRYGLLMLAENRNKGVLALLEKINNKSRIFVFHHFIASVDKIAASTPAHHKVGIYHSKMTATERKTVLTEFEDDNINVLLSCRALDEGIDIVAADVGIIAGSFTTSRQGIQRAGRVLRFQPGKIASIYTLYALGTSEENKLHSPLYENPAKTVNIKI